MPVFGDDVTVVAKAIEYDDGSIRKTLYETASIDTRSMSGSALFFAIRGEQRDGHQFAVEASERAGAIVVDETWWQQEGVKRKSEFRSPVVIVTDTVKALGDIARIHRKRYKIPMLAITGTSGKTTTKEMVVRVLETKYNVHYTKGNFNNHLGVPLTVFELKKSNEVSVIEIGMNHPGEIEYLCSIAEPTHGLITNIGKGHLGFFDSVEEVGREKGMLFRWIEQETDRVAFVNADDARVTDQAKSISNKILYGLDRDDVDISGTILLSDETGRCMFSFRRKNSTDRYTLRLPVAGSHQVKNALAAVSVGFGFGVSPGAICNALKRYTPPAKRNVVRNIGTITIIDDTYNANPDSMRAALEMFSSIKIRGKKILVLGDMLELGDKSGEEHGRLGLLLPEMGYEYLYTFGNESQAISDAAAVPFGGHYDNKDKLVDNLLKVVESGDGILVKGSRGMKMEEVIQMLENRIET